MRLGVDLGGTKTEIIALDDDGAELLRRRVDTPQNDYHAILAAIADLVSGAEAELGCEGSIGIGTPGAISPATGLMKNSNSTCLNTMPVKQDLEALLARPLRIANDANCFALSEAVDGAAAACDVVFGVILGTGTGGGVVIGKRVLTGPNAIAGEWGHNPLPWPRDSELPGPVCYCGKHGCVETFVSGPGIERDHRKVTGRSLSAREITMRAEQGDTDAEETLKRYEDRLARSLASVINVIDPDAIVLGGGMSNLQRLYRNVPRLLPQYVFSDVVTVLVLPPVFGDSSGVRGAAWLWD